MAVFRVEGGAGQAPAPTPGDVELVRMHLAGDPDAFAALFDRYHRSIYALTHRLTGDRMAAEDLTQETFFQVLRTIRRLDDDTFNISAWIHRIASNLSYDLIRARQRLPRAEPHPDSDMPDPAEQVRDTSAGADPVRTHEGNELRRQLWEVSQRLPENYRLVLHLRELQGLSYQQIAAAMNISDSAVETLLYRARIRFKEEYLADAARSGDEDACLGVRPLLREFMVSRLRAAQRRMVRDHVNSCANCAAALADLRRDRDQAGSSSSSDR